MKPVVTPRFALSCTGGLLGQLGAIAKNNHLHIQVSFLLHLLTVSQYPHRTVATETVHSGLRGKGWITGNKSKMSNSTLLDLITKIKQTHKMSFGAHLCVYQFFSNIFIYMALFIQAVTISAPIHTHKLSLMRHGHWDLKRWKSHLLWGANHTETGHSPRP